jgi:glycosyltransferase involved in cell wall biosynthesis
MSLLVSVVLPTRDPHPGRLNRTLAGLRAQTLPLAQWELIIVDNGSRESVAGRFDPSWHPQARIVREDEAGLTPARLRGIAEAQAPLLVFVDDDNVLAPDYLTQALRLFTEQSQLAAAGGPVRPEWETPPPNWTHEFHGLLALRDLGAETKICRGGPGARWPEFAPVGAGLVVRQAGALAYADALNRDPARRALDRRGRSLGSGGDNDLVFTLLHAGGDVGYFPKLQLTHLIPAGRLDAGYLARLNEAIMRTWVVVLQLHGQCPWPAVASWTVPLRIARAWWRFQPWRSPAHRIRWRGAMGQFQGQADLLCLNAPGQ